MKPHTRGEGEVALRAARRVICKGLQVARLAYGIQKVEPFKNAIANGDYSYETLRQMYLALEKTGFLRSRGDGRGSVLV